MTPSDIHESNYDRQGVGGTKKQVSGQDKKDMTDYYENGIRIGRTSEELLEELSKRYDRATRQIQRYIADQRKSADECIRHQKQLRELVNAWIGQLRWPSPKDLPEAHGGPGRYEQDGFCWSVLDSNDLSGYRPSERPERVQMRCCVENDPLFEYLKEHLEGDPVWADYRRFKNEASRYWRACKKLRELEEDQQLQDELDLERTMQDVEKLDEEVRRAAEKVRDEDHEREDLIVEEMDRIVRSMGSQIEHARQEVEERMRRLTELKPQITCRLREILDMKRLAGTCSRCPGGD